jgi:hypothetical protein
MKIGQELDPIAREKQQGLFGQPDASLNYPHDEPCQRTAKLELLRSRGWRKRAT